MVLKVLLGKLLGLLVIVRVHRLLQQMGREIVKKRSLEEPGKPHFLTDTEIPDVLDEDTVSFLIIFYICRLLFP